MPSQDFKTVCEGLLRTVVDSEFQIAGAKQLKTPLTTTMGKVCRGKHISSTHRHMPWPGDWDVLWWWRCRIRTSSTPRCQHCRVVSVVLEAAQNLLSMHLWCSSATMPSKPSSSFICHWPLSAKFFEELSCWPVMCRLLDLLSLTSR